MVPALVIDWPVTADLLWQSPEANELPPVGGAPEMDRDRGRPNRVLGMAGGDGDLDEITRSGAD
jgi:hypothetical protein